MTRYVVCMGMDEFTIDGKEFNSILGASDNPAFGRFIHLMDIDGRQRWVNISQIKMIEEAKE